MPLGRAAACKPFVLALSSFAAPALAADPFTLIVVPDTQNYTDFANINDQYNLGQMRWIRDNMTDLNIRFVMHMGDHQNPGNPYRASTTNIYEPDTSRPVGNVADREAKWGRADAAVRVLDNNNIPYSLVPGNHDYLDHDTRIEPWKYLQVFGPQRYIDEQAGWSPSKRTYGGASPAHPVNQYAGMNTYHRFDAGGYKFLNLALQAYPDEHDLRWAQQIINENPGLPTIVTTHVFVNKGNDNYQIPSIHDKLIRNNPQIVMSFNGHITGTDRIVETNIAGHTVQQMLVDYQSVQLDAQLGGNYFRGGGVLHTVQFNPNTDRVTIKGYSPIADAYLPNNFQAPDNDNVMLNFTASNFGFDLDLDRFGLPNKAGIAKSTSFRQGANGYTGTGDTYIDQNAGTANFGELDTIWVDGDRNGATAGTPESQAMIRFNSLFGNGAGQIPLGAQIESAELVLHTSDRTDAKSPNTIKLHRLLQNWTEGGAVWNTFDGFATNGLEAILAENDSVIPNTNGTVSFDVTESIAAWLAGGATANSINMGWVILPGGGNGWQFDSSEAADLLDRPQLNVTYRVVPEPGSATVLALIGLMTLSRRRRTLTAANSPR